MNGFIKILLCSFALTTVFIRNCVKDATVSIVESPVTDNQPKIEGNKGSDIVFEENSKITRGVLITHCGSCHQSTLESHKAGAIKIFDLDQGSNWHQTLEEEHLLGITNRTKNKNSISEIQKEAIHTFIALKEIQLKDHD